MVVVVVVVVVVVAVLVVAVVCFMTLRSCLLTSITIRGARGVLDLGVLVVDDRGEGGHHLRQAVVSIVVFVVHLLLLLFLSVGIFD